MAIKILSREAQLELLHLADLLEEKKRRRLVDNYFPVNGEWSRYEYPKHMQFFKAGATHHQRLFMAANRVGKTLGMGCELVYHLTGDYPDWWEGKRFENNNEWWVCGVTARDVKVVLQDLLIGKVNEFGEGLVPHDTLDFDTIKDAKRIDTPINHFRVKHVNGGWSTVEFKTYEQGRQSFQGTARSIWLDEECPQDIYAECLTRTATGDNILVMTFTPLKGPTPLIKDYIGDRTIADLDDGPIDEHRYVVQCGWDDVPHLNEKIKASLLASYPPHMRDARSKGIPALGSGVIYPVPQSEYLVEAFEIPKHWKRNYGMDVGGKTAAVWMAHDPETNVSYVYTDYYKERAEPSIHTTGIKARGEWIPGAIDPASRGRSQIDGQQLMIMYKDLGLNLRPAINAVEAGLYDCWEALSTGRIKVFRGCTNFLREIAGYMRDEKGHVVKKDDHVMDAWRYCWMTRDIAKTQMEATKREYTAPAGVSGQYRNNY
jgi:phage terminase large subunit-like protein